MDSFWSSTSFWVSIFVVVIVSVGLSAVAQMNMEEKEIRPKSLIRDGILGAIFTTIVWVMSPETMNSISSGVQSMVGGAKEATQTLGNTSSSTSTTTTTTYSIGGMDDVQVGPAKF